MKSARSRILALVLVLAMIFGTGCGTGAGSGAPARALLQAALPKQTANPLPLRRAAVM